MLIPHKIMINMICTHYSNAGILLASEEIESYLPFVVERFIAFWLHGRILYQRDKSLHYE
jgi:hypothetical protein